MKFHAMEINFRLFYPERSPRAFPVQAHRGMMPSLTRQTFIRQSSSHLNFQYLPLKFCRADSSCVRVGLVGVGGYAGYVGQTLSGATNDPNLPIRFTAMYVPDPQNHRERIVELTAGGVRFHENFTDLLNSDIDAVWLPVPMHLPGPMTEAGLSAGVAVFSEKSLAATIDDALAMRAARDRSGLPVLIGFQNTYEPATHDLKKFVLEARRSQPAQAVVTGGWPRGQDYYGRNEWAGRIRVRDQWVLDSPLSNAMAHFIDLGTFLLGPDVLESATPVSAESELYRARNIKSYDTVSLRVRFEGGSTLVGLLTHACAAMFEPTVAVYCEDFSATWRDKTDCIEITRENASSSIHRGVDPRAAMMGCRARTVGTGSVPNDVGAATLQTSIVHKTISNGASEASSVAGVPTSEQFRSRFAHADGLTSIVGIENALAAAAKERRMLHETGMFTWTKPSSVLALRDYSHFAGPESTKATATEGPAAGSALHYHRGEGVSAPASTR